jgi:L-malate glycosyltransferase
MKILHCHSTFSLGGKEARAVRLMNAFGDHAEHVILTAVPGATGARDGIDPAIKVDFPENAPDLRGRPSLRRYRALADYMRPFDLVLTYNWGSMDAVAARLFFSGRCPPLIHHEDGFNQDEAQKLNWKRNLFRQFMLGGARAVVVPSRQLEHIAAMKWRRPDVIRIPNGIDTSRYALPCQPHAIPGLERRPGDVIVGTLAGLRAVKNLPRLVRAIAPLPPHVKLVIVGEGPERAAILAEATRLGMADRLILPGFLPDPNRYVGLFDVFALSSDSEQFPISLIEVMAAGLPVAATDVGDVAAMVSDPNRVFVTPVTNEAAFCRSLAILTGDQDLRSRIGQANRALAVTDYDESVMIARYADLYGMGLQTARAAVT